LQNLNTSKDHSNTIRWLCAALCVILAAGVWLHTPYLKAELGRLTIWKLAGLYFGDVVAFCWFLRFAFAHAVLGHPLSSKPPATNRKSLKIMALGFGAVIIVDLSFSLFLMRDAYDSYHRASIAQAKILSIEKHVRELATWYELEGEFTDTYGVLQHIHLRVHADRHALPSALPPEAVLLLNGAGNERPAVRSRYDQQFPKRAWLDGAGWEDGNEIYWFSIACLCLQTGLTILLLLLMAPHTAKASPPWWWGLHKALPLAAEAFLMLASGLIDLLMDSLN
jgi:hypothetical protein